MTAVVEELRALGARVETGRFGADMKVALVNDGPVTIISSSLAHRLRDCPHAQPRGDLGLGQPGQVALRPGGERHRSELANAARQNDLACAPQ